MADKIATRESYGNALAELGKEKENLVVLDADLAGATKTGVFKKAFPDRFIDCGNRKLSFFIRNELETMNTVFPSKQLTIYKNSSFGRSKGFLHYGCASGRNDSLFCVKLCYG